MVKNALEEARAALAHHEGLPEPARRPRKRLADALRALADEYEHLTVGRKHE